jgi:hypothetical protein
MWRGIGMGIVLATAVSAAAPVSGAEKIDPVVRARALYNQGQFAAAIDAAEEARLVPGRADSSDLIAARSYLEQFRSSASDDDLTSARERLSRLDPQQLAPRERTEFVVGLGEALFFDGSYGAAAGVFDSVLSPGALDRAARERVLDWWATALDRDAKPRSDLERQTLYLRIRSRMQEELRNDPSSAAAAYWLTASARGQGDLQAAWEAAEAGWVRAPLAPDHGAALRADIDRLVLSAIVPERAKAIAQPPDQLRLEWERFKERWTK